MKTFALSLPLLALLVASTGCAHLPVSPVPAQVDAGGEWLKTVARLPGFQRIEGSFEHTNRITVTRDIAADNGATCHVVTINYTDLDGGLVSPEEFDPANTLQTVFDMGSSILQLAPQRHSASPVKLQDLFSCLNLISVINIPDAASKAKSLAAAQVSTIKDVQAFLGMLQQFQSLQATNFQSLLGQHIRELLEDQLSTFAIKQTNSLTVNVSLDAIMAAYLNAYLNGTFVDRWGTTLSQPDMTKLGSDSVVPLTKVALEAVFDYGMMTPIVHDSSPSGTNRTPTFAVIFPQLYEDISENPDAPGITAPESEAIKYLSGLSGEGAKHLSALIVKSLGGAAVGVKVSTGDNSTFSQVISTFSEEFFRRNTEEFLYDFFEKFQYYPTPTNSLFGYAPNIAINNQQMAELKDLYGLDDLFQMGVVAALVSQDELKALAQGGWKLSPGNITNYQALATKLLGTNDLAVQLFNQLSPSIQDILKSSPAWDASQRQALIDALNQLTQTNNSIFDPNLLPEASRSPDTKAILNQQPGNAPLQRFQHLNVLLLMDAFGRN
jgi:hypothetical protein